MPMISIRNLSVSYALYPGIKGILLSQQRKLALHDITLQIDGGVHGVIGLNGAGKSTLMKVLATLLEVKKGKALVAGYDVCTEPHKVRSMIGYATGSDRSFYYRLSGEQNLEFFGSLQGLQGSLLHKRITQCLAHTGLSDVKAIRFDRYSQGMRQRLGIARALLHQPKVLLLDEPTDNVDFIGSERIKLLLQKLSKEGVTVLVTTHDLSEITKLCKSISVLHHGRIIHTFKAPLAFLSLEKHYKQLVLKNA